MKVAKTCCCTLAVALCVAAASSAQAGLVAKWDFNNYDPANPTSPNVLGKKTLEFASGVTVNVLASSKNATRTANGKQIISWSAIPEGVTFQPVKKAQRLVPKADGLYLEGAGFSLIVR